jgi:diguanylate cyclase (GGDEF)-like protein
MENTLLTIGFSKECREAVERTVEPTGLFDTYLFAGDTVRTVRILEDRAVDAICFAWDDNGAELTALTQLLQHREEWRDIPVLLFAHGDAQEMRIAALEWGASDCLVYGTGAREATLQIQWHLKNRQRIETLRSLKAEFARKAILDGLTGLYNRAYLDAVLDQNVALSRRGERPLAFLLIDLDHFKRINDRYGHYAGDEVLRQFADVLRQGARKSDIVCRYGGEEFAVILPDCTASQAVAVARRIHNNLAERNLATNLTVSIGVCSSSEEAPLDSRQLVEQADQALYAAKRRGRNRTEVYSSPAMTTVEGAARTTPRPATFPMLLRNAPARA